MTHEMHQQPQILGQRQQQPSSVHVHFPHAHQRSPYPQHQQNGGCNGTSHPVKSLQLASWKYCGSCLGDFCNISVFEKLQEITRNQRIQFKISILYHFKVSTLLHKINEESFERPSKKHPSILFLTSPSYGQLSSVSMPPFSLTYSKALSMSPPLQPLFPNLREQSTRFCSERLTS